MAKLDLGYKTVELYLPGTLFEADIVGQTYRTWEILRNTIIWEQSGEPAQMLTILAIDAEGEDVGKDTIIIHSDMYDIKEI